MINGIIVKGIGGFYYVDTPEGLFECKLRGHFRRKKITPCAGDIVGINITGDGKGVVEEIATRKNEFFRPPVANIDQIVVIVSQAPPVANTYLIDRLAATASVKNCGCVICINKCDLDPGDELFAIYGGAGFDVIRVSAKTGTGMGELSAAISGKISTFVGNSGVGKSSMLNALEPDFGLEAGDISKKIGRGRHTTRHVELLKLKNGGLVADTPGFSAFDTELLAADLLTDPAIAFREFAPYLGKCRFSDCAHVKDKGCAVLQAVERGEIHRSRYDSYVKLYNQAKEIKKWEL